MEEDQNVDQEATATETDGEEAASKEVKATKKKASSSASKKTDSLSKDQLIEVIKQMTVIELADLVKALEEEFGVSAAAPVAVAAAPASAAEEEAVTEEEQTEFNVILTSFGESKINVIKAVREVAALGLKEAKELVESAPKAVKEGVPKDEASVIKEKLEAVGATIEIK